MQVVRAVPPAVAPAPMFTGHVWFTYHSGDSPVACAKLHFAPGARTAWHTHPRGQILYVLEGVARVQERGGAYEDVRAGESVVCPGGVEHWHGAAPGHVMTHLAVHEGPVAWGDPVSYEDYRG